VRNCVLLKHVPTGLLVRCQKTRSLDDNRRVARKLLLQKLDDHVNGALSVRSVKIDRLRKKKKNKRARAKAKYGASAPEEEGEDGEDGEDDSDEEEDGEDSEDEEQRP
jgi:protein subunit release factor B